MINIKELDNLSISLAFIRKSIFDKLNVVNFDIDYSSLKSIIEKIDSKFSALVSKMISNKNDLLDSISMDSIKEIFDFSSEAKELISKYLELAKSKTEIDFLSSLVNLLEKIDLNLKEVEVKL